MTTAAPHSAQHTAGRFRPCPRYKDSGVEWLGEIPEHWAKIRLKYAFRFVSGGTPPTGDLRYWNGDLPWVSPKDMKTLYLEDTQDHITEDAVRESATDIIPEGGALLVMRSGILRHSIPVAVARKRMALNQDLKGLIPRTGEIVSEYFARFVEGHQAQLLTEWRKEGATVESLEYGPVANFEMLAPPRDEQRAIAAFLDRETARIDTLIEKKQRQVELLQEKRAALISHAVTKGLDPNVKMKDSGVEWLGEIPEHWEVHRLKYSADLINRKVEGVEADLPYMRLEHIESWTGKRIGQNGDTTSDGQANLYRRGDVLFGKLRPYLAKAYAADSDGICTGELLVLRPKAVKQKYLLGYVLNPDFIAIVDSSTYGAKMPRANWDFIGNLPTLIPPFTEQRAIAAFLDREMSRIDALIERIRKSIDLLREYRTALISAAVTGKIDVRLPAPPARATVGGSRVAAQAGEDVT